MAIRTLNEIAHLKDSTCGKPYPRHGLQLLYWFACDCVDFEDGQPFLEYDPSDGDFGFKEFHNKENLLPYWDNPYYEVGNLNSDRAFELPDYVKENYDSNQEITNADRIIICLDDNKWLEKTYVTRHFDKNHTYCISKGLLELIRSKNFPDLNSFLKKAGYVIHKTPAVLSRQIDIPDEKPPNQNLSGPVTGQNHASVKRPAETHIAMPEGRPTTSTWRPPPPKGWSIWECTIL